MSRAPGALAACLGLLSPCCSPEQHAAAPEVSAPREVEPLAGPARFQIRGRWPGSPRAIRYRFEPAPADGSELVAQVEAAMAVWAATGLVSFEPARSEQADLVVGMRRGHHGACEPFGVSGAVAHAGPVGPGTFVHFDAGRTWSPRGGAGTVSLFHTALHELGHVLGLGHSGDETAVMSNAPGDRGELSADDLAGLRSLYGSGPNLPAGSLVVRGPRDEELAVLCGVAPPDTCGHIVFDADGDGRDEVLVYRADRAGHGAVSMYRFGAGPKLVGSAGPFHGVVLPGAEVLTVEEGGVRTLVSVLPDGRTAARRFDPTGAPTLPSEMGADLARAVGRHATRGDLDGDGVEEHVGPLPTER